MMTEEGRDSDSVICNAPAVCTTQPLLFSRRCLIPRRTLFVILVILHVLVLVLVLMVSIEQSRAEHTVPPFECSSPA